MLNLMADAPKYDCHETKAEHQAILEAVEAFEREQALRGGKYFVFQVVL